jgi:hypothetical protein
MSDSKSKTLLTVKLMPVPESLFLAGLDICHLGWKCTEQEKLTRKRLYTLINRAFELLHSLRMCTARKNSFASTCARAQTSVSASTASRWDSVSRTSSDCPPKCTTGRFCPAAKDSPAEGPAVGEAFAKAVGDRERVGVEVEKSVAGGWDCCGERLTTGMESSKSDDLGKTSCSSA